MYVQSGDKNVTLTIYVLSKIAERRPPINRGNLNLNYTNITIYIVYNIQIYN